MTQTVFVKVFFLQFLEHNNSTREMKQHLQLQIITNLDQSISPNNQNCLICHSIIIFQKLFIDKVEFLFFSY